jgi:hypothetical protein
MSLESEAKIARYAAVEREADEFGRVIGVRRLKPSEQVKVTSLTADLTGYDESDYTDPETGETKKLKFPHRITPLIAAAVCEIDGAKIPFAKTRGELDAMLDRLDAEGLKAAGTAFNRLAAANAPMDQETAANL